MKWTKRLACTVLACACVLSGAGAADTVGSLSPQGARAYMDVLNGATTLCGPARVAQDGSYQGMWEGVSLARLIDFDGDGAPELYYAGRVSGSPVFQRLFAYRDGKALRVEIPNAVSNFGTDLSPSTRFYIGADKAYLVDGHEVMNGGTVTYYTVKDGQPFAALTYTDADGQFPDGTSGAHVCTLNGKTVSYEELKKELAAFTAGMEKAEYSFWELSDIARSPAGTVEQTTAALRALTNPTATVSEHLTVIDGKGPEKGGYRLGMYEINGNNYVKLRDVAKALSGTDAQFEVVWNGAEKRIELTAGRAYTPVGGEYAAPPAESRAAALTEAAVCLDGKELALTAYEIAGNNYFKLRDLGAALDFWVGWDGSAQLVQIDTQSGYQPDS
ncbi:MAG: hypothetical protein Q4C72_04950 [Eubacteriales bacterium]|nr:hypothetical protein [Eubacteriales bacterium]